MRQTTPWGGPSTNPGAFGIGADDNTFGQRLRMPGVSPDQVRLGDPGDPADPADPADPDPNDPTTGAELALETGKSTPAYASIAKSLALASIGGAIVGYLATGGKGWHGAVIGASTNASLVYAGTAIAGRKAYSNAMLAGLALMTVATAAAAGYLYMGQRKGR